jgi:hypothetical protein
MKMESNLSKTRTPAAALSLGLALTLLGTILPLSNPPTASAALISISQEPSTNTVSIYDDVLINATNFGLGTWTTKRATVQTVLSLVSTNYATTNLVAGLTNAWQADATNFNLQPRMAYARREKRLPIMGYNNGRYGFRTAQDVTNCVNWMVSGGLVAAGFNFLEMDDGWFTNATPYRDPVTHAYIVDVTKWPNGILPAVQYANSKGVHVGWYYGNATIGSGPNAYTNSYPEIDALFLVTNNIEYIKIDGPPLAGGVSDTAWVKRLVQCADYFCLLSNRPPIWIEDHDYSTDPFLYSVCDCVSDTGDPTGQTSGLLTFNDIGVRWARHHYGAAPLYGFYLDPTLYATYYACQPTNYLNALFAGESALALLSSELQICSPQSQGAGYTWTGDGSDLTILTNRDLIAIDQDRATQIGHPIWSNGNSYIWLKPLGSAKGPDWAVGLWNQNTNAGGAATISFSFTNLPGKPAMMSVLDVRYGTNFMATNAITQTCIEQEMKLYRLTPYRGPSVVLTNLDGTVSTYVNGLLTSCAVPYTQNTNKLVIWLDASAQTYADGTATNWSDQSFYHNNATNTANWPVFHTAVQNGLPAYLFNGTSSTLFTPYGGTGTNWSVLAVQKLATGATGNNFKVGKNYLFGMGLYDYADTSNTYYPYAYSINVGTPNTAQQTDGWAIWVAVHNGADMYLLGPSGISNHVNNAAMNVAMYSTPLVVGSADGTSGYFNGHLGEILFFEDADDAKVQATYAHLKSKWNLP